ncbi:MAG: ribonuclease Z [Clostridia bacterium]|nr:ribonuclease Z [Clostridia bacterium]
MNIIVCLDDKNGMLFNNRRQSSDRLLRERIFEITAGKRLWMNGYSAKQFEDYASGFVADEYFLQKAQKGDFCFVENSDINSFMSKIEKIIVYRWNKTYPSDRKFPAELLDDENKQPNCFEFAGHSHEKITEEIYCL